MTTTMLERGSARRAIYVMGTVFSIDIRQVALPMVDVADAIDAVEDWLRWVDLTYSTYRVDSQISRLGRGEITLDDCHDSVAGVLQACADVHRVTRGYFSPLLDGRIDPTGLVKGWSAAQASRMLRGAGLPCHAISAGGDVVCAGEPAPGEPWRVGIADPMDATSVAAVVVVRDRAVATSGVTQRGHHVVDPHTGAPARGLLSATVIGPDLTFADAYATGAIAAGPTGCDWMRDAAGYDLMTIAEGGDVASTPGFGQFIDVRRATTKGRVLTHE